jgi:muconolactone delta-isomerase
MQFFIRFDVRQPDDMSNRELIEMWDRETDAALAAMEAGAVTHLWKVAGQRVVIGVLELPDAETVDRALAGLPIIKEIGATVQTEVLPIYDYATFAADLKEALKEG